MNQPSLKELKSFYKAGNLKEVAKWLPHLRHKDDPFIRFLMNGNILKMKTHISDPIVTLGADPEFILHEKGKKHEIVLFSSKYTTGYFGISEAEVGADYGLLEFRPEPVEKPMDLVKAMNKLHIQFRKRYPDFKILEKEAVEYDHKRSRLLESMQEEKDINYGMNRGKDVGVWGGSDDIIIGMESGVSLSAYDKPAFNQFNDKLFTAGGHIHIGGGYIMMLSTDQLKSFVRKLDTEILPICEKVETKAAELRRSVYGTPGEFRIKNYGIEYRAPSNAIFWQKNSKPLLKILSKIIDIVKTMATSDMED
jgi:hypothetical protein